MDRRRRAESLVLPPSSVEHRRTLFGRQRACEVFARASRLKGIAKPFIFVRGTFERRPGSGRIALPETHESDGAVDRRSQHSDRPGGCVQPRARKPVGLRHPVTRRARLLALALIAQLSKDTALLPVFALAVLPVVCFLGLVTYGRLLECGMQDVFYARSISRIRRLYRELDPSRAHYFHEVGVDQSGPPTPELVTLRVQQFLPGSAMVAIVNSVVGGVFIAFAAAYLLAPPTWVAAALGIVSTVVISIAFLTHQRLVWGKVDRIDPLTAPSPDHVKAE